MVFVLGMLVGIVAGAVFLANMPKPTGDLILKILDVRSPK